MSETSKHNALIQAKIHTKEDEIKGVTQTGPLILIILGTVLCITIIGILIGLPMILISAWWMSKRDNQKKKLQNEIKELQIELSMD